MIPAQYNNSEFEKLTEIAAAIKRSSQRRGKIVKFLCILVCLFKKHIYIRDNLSGMWATWRHSGWSVVPECYRCGKVRQ